MARAPDVTFVIPNYNSARYIGQTIESILAQTDPDFRVVVADNRSTDASVEVARAYRDDRLSIVVGDSHVSMSGNWNRCIGYVESPYFVLAHSDDLYEPGYLAAMLPIVRQHERAFVAHCAVVNVDSDGNRISLPLERYKDLFYPRSDPYCRPPCEEAAWLRKGNYIQAPSAIYRTEYVHAVGTFRETFQFVPDWEYWLRGVFAGYQIAGTRERLVRYRRHPGSLSTALEGDLRRYEEEIALLEWLAPAGFAAGCFHDSAAEYGLASNTIVSGVADRLVRGDATGAARVTQYARSRIPGFSWSPRDIALRCAVPAGRAGGHVLGWGRRAYLELLTWRNT